MSMISPVQSHEGSPLLHALCCSKTPIGTNLRQPLLSIYLSIYLYLLCIIAETCLFNMLIIQVYMKKKQKNLDYT